jgi:hypothetical protein
MEALGYRMEGPRYRMEYPLEELGYKMDGPIMRRKGLG